MPCKPLYPLPENTAALADLLADLVRDLDLPRSSMPVAILHPAELPALPPLEAALGDAPSATQREAA